jgi:hypothetical protein
VRAAGRRLDHPQPSGGRDNANLTFVLDDLPGWEQAILTELAAKKFTGAWTRSRWSAYL